MRGWKQALTRKGLRRPLRLSSFEGSYQGEAQLRSKERNVQHHIEKCKGYANSSK